MAVELLRELGVDPAAAAAAGDSESDVTVAEAVGLPIAYDLSSEHLDRVARHHLRHGELPRLCELVRGTRDG